MPTDKLEVGNLTFVDLETGQKTKIDTIPSLTMVTDETSQFEPIKALEELPEITVTSTFLDMFYKSFTVIGTIEEIAREVFLNMPLGHEVVDLDFKQNKTHKKKRINKKWARKYGYTCKVYYQ